MELLLKIFSPFGGKEFPKGFEEGREMKAGPYQSYIFQVLHVKKYAYALAQELSFVCFSLF